MQKINVSPRPNQSFQAVLDGQNCVIRLYQREKHLYLDLQVEEHTVCVGAICRNGAEVLQSPSPHFKGGLHFFDQQGACDPHWEGLGSRYILLYLKADETPPPALAF